jgi:hypothetical protein
MVAVTSSRSVKVNSFSAFIRGGAFDFEAASVETMT